MEERTARRRQPSSRPPQNKPVLDTLSGITYDDDSLIKMLHLAGGYDKENPRIEIAIS